MSTTKAKLSALTARLEPIVARQGFELVDTEMVSERGRSILRLYIDTVPPGTKERGVTVEDCSNVSRVVSDLLDVEEMIEGQYTLEVSSPGIFRPLTKHEHYDRALGERVRVKTYDKIEGRRVFTGTLKQREEDRITVQVDGTDFVVPLAQVAKANLEPEL